MATVVRLKCEYSNNPLGIDVLQPRFSWQMEDARRGAAQRAYQILVASSPEKLSGSADLWDSGRVDSAQSLFIPYAGKSLASQQRCFWTVRIWDQLNVPTNLAATAFFEMGLLNKSDWKAAWIGSSVIGGPRTSSPCPFVRKKFTVTRTIRRARLYATAQGLYECHLNGQRVGDQFFRPGWTEYRKHLQYDTYDVTSLLRSGPNVIGAILGDGWYVGRIQAMERQQWGDRPKFFAQLFVEYDDGSTQLTATDASWKTAPGPILISDILSGEHYDARLEMPCWSESHFDESAWTPVLSFPDSTVPLIAPPGPPVRIVKEHKPIKPAETAKKLTWGYNGQIFDLGQNMVGKVRITVQGKRGGTIRLRYAEVLNPDGSMYTTNLRSAEVTDYYTLKSDQPETWEPRFTFHGFRFVELASFQKFEVLPDGIVGIVMHSDTPATGEFECSDPLINQLQKNIQWGQRGNFLEVPTDCPQRDERLGWTGDAQVFARTASFNMDVSGFFAKWVGDITDSQSERGSIPMVIPNGGCGDDGGAAWADAGIICPWTMYLCFGDTRLLEKNYPMFVKFLNFLQETSRDHVRGIEGVNAYVGFGDWLAMDGSDNWTGSTPRDLISTAFFAHSARLLGRIARVLNKKEDAQKYEALFEKIREAFQKYFVTPAGLIAGQTQTAHVLALHFDLLPEAMRKTVADNLVRDIRKRNNHLATGFVGTSYLNDVLTNSGHLDVAYTLLYQKTWPSWLYAVTQGATTIWERWDGWTHDKGFQDAGMNSFNHYAYGAIGQWLYATVAGIDLDPNCPAYQRIIFHPHPPMHDQSLTHAKATLQSPFGKIESSWRLENGVFTLNLLVPANTTGLVCLPTQDAAHVRESGETLSQRGWKIQTRNGHIAVEVEAGHYSFVVG